jgi:hypothetical protein
VKPFERRAAGAYPYFKLASWSERNQCWNDGKAVFETQAAAKAEASAPGKYRLSQITDAGRRDLESFEVCA